MQNTSFTRAFNRTFKELRPVSIQTNVAPNALGSVLLKFGNTQVICAATFEKAIPKWMAQQSIGGGWLSAEYAMLPYSTLDRKQRDSTRGKIDGRNIEIQRLIGRSLRAAIDLKKITGYTLWIDCDVLQADGGTRTASITGAFVAAKIATHKLLQKGDLLVSPFHDSVAAVSVGLLNNLSLLDLDYKEDKDAQVDFNVVMTGSGKFVEIQGAGEEHTFSESQLSELLELAKEGIQKLTQIQMDTLRSENIP